MKNINVNFEQLYKCWYCWSAWLEGVGLMASNKPFFMLVCLSLGLLTYSRFHISNVFNGSTSLFLCKCCVYTTSLNSLWFYFFIIVFNPQSVPSTHCFVLIWSANNAVYNLYDLLKRVLMDCEINQTNENVRLNWSNQCIYFILFHLKLPPWSLLSAVYCFSLVF